ncbi:MAG TPA: phosphate/phosphite/phosphonate ABC transporter substrate-binding protein [Methylococcaceae bacterium]|nr:phosphate/phosphite/phosphonate ABC transporter substrate-binding protein [Methylococcaceae bacterium]
MSHLFTVSPDFTPDHLSGWFIFNTWLQRASDLPIHLQLYDDFASQRAAIQADKVDLIYANPYDAAMLVRDKGFKPLVKPTGVSDEAIIAVNAASSVTCVEDLLPGSVIAVTEDPDVKMMGMIMLEPACLDKSNVTLADCDTYVLIAKKLLKNEADAGIFLAEAYNDLSSVVRNQLRILVQSKIYVIHHALMAGPRLLQHRERLQQLLTGMADDPKGKGILEALKFTGWEVVDDEDMEFMIDLMDTLGT